MTTYDYLIQEDKVTPKAWSQVDMATHLAGYR